MAESFRLFASITTSKNEMCHAMEGQAIYVLHIENHFIVEQFS